jgi:hypothetical protein
MTNSQEDTMIDQIERACALDQLPPVPLIVHAPEGLTSYLQPADDGSQANCSTCHEEIVLTSSDIL